jgi:hypothetical protein
VTSRDHLAEAVAELYTADPEEFTERRAALVALARADGEAVAARQIGALRKPTRSAWVVNQLARTDSGLAGQLIALGDDFRAAQTALDGARMRALSVQRRQLIDTLAQRAFTAAGQQAPPAALRDEVTATLGAALADPQVAAQLQAGTLVRAVRPGAFSPAPGPVLTLLPSLAPADASPATAPARKPARARTAAAAAAEAEARERAAQERRSRILADAERRAAEADQAVEAAAGQEAELQRAVELIEAQLTDSRRSLDQARLQARRARTAQRAAHQALGRLQR